MENKTTFFAADNDIRDSLKSLHNALVNGDMSYKTARGFSEYVDGAYSTENKKLKPTDKTDWFIFNLPAVKTCPNATNSCIQLCYALKAEKQYPNVKNQRHRNFEFSKSESFVSYMLFMLTYEISRAEKQGKVLNIRIHESGDFYDREYIEKWLEIVKTLNELFSGKFTIFCYSKSLPLFNNKLELMLLNVRASVWADTDPAQLDIIKSYDLPIYTAYDGDTIKAMTAAGEKFFKCRCKDCATCGACRQAAVKKIICEIH